MRTIILLYTMPEMNVLTCELKGMSKSNLQHLIGGRGSRTKVRCTRESRSNVASNVARMNQLQTFNTCVHKMEIVYWFEE